MHASLTLLMLNRDRLFQFYKEVSFISREKYQRTALYIINKEINPAYLKLLRFMETVSTILYTSIIIFHYNVNFNEKLCFQFLIACWPKTDVIEKLCYC